MTFSFVLLSCKKGESDDSENCEENNLTKVTYSNVGSTPVRVVVATSLTPQYEPINPVFSIELAPGQSVPKEFEAEQYFNVWYGNCSGDDCVMLAYYSKTYAQCNEYEEKPTFN